MATRALMVQGVGRRSMRRAPPPVVHTVSLFAGLSASIALASTFLLIVSLALAVLHVVRTTRPGRRFAARCARHASHRRRELRLVDQGVAYEELVSLHAHVSARIAADARDPFATSELLDRYVDTAVARQRCIDLLVSADRERLERRHAALVERRPQTAAVLARRIVQTREVEVRLIALDRSLGELAELIRYTADLTGEPVVVRPVEDRVGDALAVFDGAA